VSGARAGPHPGFLKDFAETRGYLLGRAARVQVTPGGGAVLFLRSPPRSPEQALYELDVRTGQVRKLCDPQALLGGAEEVVSAAEQARRERQRITYRGFTGFLLSPDGSAVLLTLSGRLLLVDRATGQVRALTEAEDEPPIDPRFSPDGKRLAFVRAADLYVLDLDPPGAAARAVTSGGSEDRTHGLAEFVAQEEMGRAEGYWWSPDSDRLAYAEVDQREVETFAIADPARPERPPLVFRYPRAGRANARVRLGIVEAAPGSGRPPPATWVDWDRARYPYLARVLWDTPRAPLAILVQTRDQREAALLTVDPENGTTRRILVETDEDWINLEPSLPRWLPDGSGLLWASERSGRKALELRRPDGSLERELVPGGEDFLEVAHVAPDARSAYVLLGDAVGNRIVRLDLSSGARDAITADAAEHAPVFARDGSVFVDTRVAADALPEARVCRFDGAPLAVLPSVAEEPPFRVQLELLQVGEGRVFRAAVIRPRAFDPSRRYPVIVHVYGGPHALMVKADERNYLLDQWIADHGALVVCIDNRGTPRRDRSWERAIKGSFGEIPLNDQIEGLHALARRVPQMDLDWVGIYGWSFGGYLAALAVLRRPDVFKVAVAGAPVVDWRDYDTHYTERYLDRPERNPEGYRASSLLTYAGGLARPLLIVHGTADDNVYFFHSLKLAEALFRAGHRFEFLPLAGVTHQIADSVVREQLWARVTQFLLAPLGLGMRA
jgi:dipeptidyl-peptidase 4